VLIVLWVAAIASAIVDNIPFTATMLPITAFLTKTIPGAETGVLWWALVLEETAPSSEHLQTWSPLVLLRKPVTR